MINDNTKRRVSLFGNFLYGFELFFLKNIRNFIGRNEKMIEISFLIMYFVIQGYLAFRIQEVKITIIIMILLLALSIERISIYIWKDYEKEKLDFKEKNSRSLFQTTKDVMLEKIHSLEKENIKLEEKLNKKR